MNIGAHVSAAGGVWNAPLRAKELGLETFQFFTRSPQGFGSKPLTEEDIAMFRKNCEAAGFEKYYTHAPYIINLASPTPKTRGMSVGILRTELERGTQLGVTAMMMHPGSSKGEDKETALAHVAEGIKKIMDGYTGTTQFLIEISAGAGDVVGASFEEVAAILKAVDDERIGVCFDTAHAFASGYDLRTAAAVKETMKKFDDLVGLDRLVLSHCNDSKVELGARKDRHEHIGDGHIGRDGFAAIVASKEFSNVHLILETEPEGQVKDVEILYSLRG